MVSAVNADLGYNQPSTEQTTRIKRWLNEGYRHIMSEPGREQLRDATITLTTEASRATYPLAQAATKVYAITQVSNSMRLGFKTLSQYRSINPGLNQNTDFSTHWVPYGWAPVLRQPEGTGLWMVSDNAADTTQRFNVKGFYTNGDETPATQSAVLNGVTRVQIGTATTWNLIERLDLTAVAVGIVRVYDAAVGGNEIIRLQPGQTSAQYQHIILFPTPSSAIDYKLDVCLALTELVNDNDIPLLPADFHDMIPLYARKRAHETAGDAVRLAADQLELRVRRQHLIDYVDFPKDYQPIVGRQNEGIGWNNTGAYYPADYTWPN